MSITNSNNNGGILTSQPPPFTSINTLPQTTSPSSSSDNNDLNPSLVITVLILATAIILSASIYLLLKFIRGTPQQQTTTTATTVTPSGSHRNNNHHHNRHGRVVPEQQETSIINSLPLFTYASLSTNSNNSDADCAVCLSKFEQEDRLRLLPACCHAFHADCIDVWLITNQTCPLCRSSIFVTESEFLNKPVHTTTTATATDVSSRRDSSAHRSGSFRVEIGSVSRRRLPSDFTGRSYSIGSFEYILDDDNVEVAVPVEQIAVTRSVGDEYVVEVDDKQRTDVVSDTLAAEVGGGVRSGGGGGGGSWLKDYVDRLAWAASCSLSSSLRSSGRFFGGSNISGSSRRTEVLSRSHDPDLEASRLGDEIGEMFRWLSGV